jgi:hypothetical protein
MLWPSPIFLPVGAALLALGVVIATSAQETCPPPHDDYRRPTPVWEGFGRQVNACPGDKIEVAASLKVHPSLNHDLWEWIEWLHSIDDKELIEQAKRMDIELGEIPLPEPDQFQRPGLWKISSAGGEVLYTESQQAIIKTIRERMPVYRKEQRELVELYFKGVTLFIGAMGTIIALVAVLKK